MRPPKNLGTLDVNLRGLLAALMLVASVITALKVTPLLGATFLVGSLFLYTTAGLAHCPIYHALGIRTLPHERPAR